MNTIIIIKQTSVTSHEIKIRGTVPEEQLDMIAAKLEKINHPDGVTDVISNLGLEVIERDDEGCWDGSEFEYLDDRQEADI